MTSKQEGDILFAQAILFVQAREYIPSSYYLGIATREKQRNAFKCVIQGIVRYGHYPCHNIIREFYLIDFFKDKISDLFLHNSIESKFIIAIANQGGAFGFKKNEEEAFNLLLQLASENVAYAMYYLSLAFVDGRGTSKDLEKGKSYVIKSIELGIVEAYYLLGLAYSYSIFSMCNLNLKDDFYLTVINFQRAYKLGFKAMEHFINLVRGKYPNLTIPWGRWTIEGHFLTPDKTKQEIFTWLLIWHKLHIVPKGIHFKVIEYICTK